MNEGKVEIFLSYKEPEYRDNIMWLRPYLDREGYELLYYGANGWTVFIPCHPSLQEGPLTEINCKCTENNIPNEDTNKVSSCGC